VEKSLFLTALLMAGVWFDVLEVRRAAPGPPLPGPLTFPLTPLTPWQVVGAACFFLGQNSIFLFAHAFLAQHYRESLYVTPENQVCVMRKSHRQHTRPINPRIRRQD
jgi:hypothetical protein